MDRRTLRLVNYSREGKKGVGFLVDEKIVDLNACVRSMPDQRLDAFDESPPGRILDLASPTKLSAARAAFDYCAGNGVGGYSLGEVKLLPPVERPNKVFWIDGNYPVHNLWEDKGLPLPSDFRKYAPAMYLRPSPSVIGHGDTLRLPSFVDEAWASTELGLVVGKEATKVRSEEAEAYVLGYTVTLDGGANLRAVNGKLVDVDESNFFGSLYGKYLDGCAPMGPCLIPRDDIDVDSLHVTLRLNGERVQDFSTEEMFFSPGDIIETASHITTLYPGDVFATGSGARKPFNLKDGDKLEAEIEPIGKLEVFVARGR